MPSTVLVIQVYLVGVLHGSRCHSCAQGEPSRRLQLRRRTASHVVRSIERQGAVRGVQAGGRGLVDRRHDGVQALADGGCVLPYVAVWRQVTKHLHNQEKKGGKLGGRMWKPPIRLSMTKPAMPLGICTTGGVRYDRWSDVENGHPRTEVCRSQPRA